MFRVFLILFCFSMWTKAQSPKQSDPWEGKVKPQGRLQAQRAAVLDAYRNMAERIKGLRINSATLVKDFVTENDQIETELNTFIKGIRPAGNYRYNEDFTVEIDMEVTLVQVVALLKQTSKRYFKDGKWKEETFNQMTEYEKAQVLQVTGNGVVPELFQIVEDIQKKEEPLESPSEEILLPEKIEEEKAVLEHQKIIGSYFGIETQSKRILFIIDLSGSMNDPLQRKGKEQKIERVKTQLKQSIENLALEAEFILMTYKNKPTLWKDSPIQASLESKEESYVFIEEMRTGGATNMYDALKLAYELVQRESIEVIFFLTDGSPTGKIKKPEEILRQVEEWRTTAPVQLHTIGLGEDHKTEFLERLAHLNQGQYLQILE